MRTLIRNGIIHTMSPLGTLRGDVLIEGQHIAAVAPCLDVNEHELTHIIDATSLHVCPGLIDAHVHLIRAADRIETDVRAMKNAALSSGVTTFALWQEGGQACILCHGEQELQGRKIIGVNAENLRDDALRRVFAGAALRGDTVGCEICSENTARRVIRMKKETGCRTILVHLSNCCNMLDEFTSSNCPVILGACCLRGNGNVYDLAMHLQRAGATVAITADYPATRMHYLPMTAGLCVRSGMTTDEALRTVTLDAARLLGLGDLVGSIEPGKSADINIVDGEPLTFTSVRAMTFCKGELL